MNNLQNYGLCDHFTHQAGNFPGLNIARVIAQYSELYRVVSAGGESLAEVSGRFRYDAVNAGDFPVVGDFVMVDGGVGESNAVIHHVLTRKSALERVAAGQSGSTQVVAANIDIIFICMALDGDFNLSRLERFLSAAWDSGATPVVVLTKSDLCDDVDDLLAEVSSVAIGAETLVTSSSDEASYRQLQKFLTGGQTASFIGSSGVGKSTLINRLAGSELLATSEVRSDGKGRHTSTRRELVVLPGGGIVIDTPGMREFAVDSVDLSRSFADIEELSRQCRFSDCGHNAEPGCRVRAALESGELGARRYENFKKLQKEARYTGLNAKQLEKVKLNDMFSKVGGMKKVKKLNRERQSRKFDDN